jgi:hypothetical protein
VASVPVVGVKPQAFEKQGTVSADFYDPDGATLAVLRHNLDAEKRKSLGSELFLMIVRDQGKGCLTL